MNLGSVVGGIAKGRMKRRGQAAMVFAAATTGFRIFRRMTRMSNRPAIRFEVKPGEIYEIRGMKRGK